MPQPGRRRHQQLPVHHLVAVGVVGERADHVRRVINRRSHSHMIASSAQQMQAQTTYDDERYGVTPGNHFKTSRNKKTRGMGLPAGPHSCALWIGKAHSRQKSQRCTREPIPTAWGKTGRRARVDRRTRATHSSLSPNADLGAVSQRPPLLRPVPHLGIGIRHILRRSMRVRPPARRVGGCGGRPGPGSVSASLEHSGTTRRAAPHPRVPVCGGAKPSPQIPAPPARRHRLDRARPP